jgi:mRNA interferase RelE/StbE
VPDKITKFIKSLSAKVREQLKSKLLDLKKNPFGMKGVKKLKSGSGDFYRLRMGKIRIIYRVIGENGVEITDIDYRGNIY